MNLSAAESKIVDAAVAQGYQTVVCGHTHVPKEKETTVNGKTVRYLNCGDWVEHFSAAEYSEGRWSLCYFNEIAEELQPDELEIPADIQLYSMFIRKSSFANLK